jgi:hypothetical protein
MYWSKSMAWFKQDPKSAFTERLNLVSRLTRSVPKRGVIDPLNVARQTGLDPMETMGYLNILAREGEGRFVVRVIDTGGKEIRRFPTVKDVPSVVEDEFGEEFVVGPENIDIAFQPTRIVRGPRTESDVE